MTLASLLEAPELWHGGTLRPPLACAAGSPHRQGAPKGNDNVTREGNTSAEACTMIERLMSEPANVKPNHQTLSGNSTVAFPNSINRSIYLQTNLRSLERVFGELSIRFKTTAHFHDVMIAFCCQNFNEFLLETRSNKMTVQLSHSNPVSKLRCPRRIPQKAFVIFSFLLGHPTAIALPRHKALQSFGFRTDCSYARAFSKRRFAHLPSDIFRADLEFSSCLREFSHFGPSSALVNFRQLESLVINFKQVILEKSKRDGKTTNLTDSN